MDAVAVTSTRIAVEHVKIRSSLTFDEVRRKLEETLPPLDAAIIDELSRGEADKASAYDESGPALSIFLTRNHGALLAIVGHAREAIQYEIGNPLTASKMTRHRLAAGLYAPLRVILYESEEGNAVIEYDRPSSLFGQFGDASVTEVGRGLDAALESALRRAAG